MTPLVEAIIRAFPQLDSNGSSPSVIEGGQNALVLDFGSHIVRVARYPGQEQVFRREATVLTLLASRLPLPVPAISLRDVEGTLVAVHEKLPGTPLFILSNLDPAQVGAIAGQLAGFLRSLHRIPVTSLAQAGVPVEDATFWEQWLATVRIRLYPLVERDAAKRFDRQATMFLADYHDNPFGLKHGDFGGGNILADDSGITGIIDFGSVAIGDVASDIAGLAASYGDPFLELITETYPEVHAMKLRVAFYRLAFAAMEALHGLEHDDAGALQAGLASLDRSR